MFVKYYIISLVILSVIGEICGLIELPKGEENDIISTDTIIRTTTNKLFGCLKLRPNKDRRLKQFAKVHNYLVSITLQDYVNLKQISSLSKFYKIDNTTRHFIAYINDIFNEDRTRVDLKNNSSNATDNDDANILQHVSRFFDEDERLKEFYGVNKESIDSNLEELKNIQNASRNKPQNHTIDDNKVESDENDNSTVNESEYWVPDSEPENDTRRVFKGIRVKIKKFPFMASVQLFNKFHCAGSIIKSDLVITAASCLQLAHNNRLFRENPNYISVRIGSTHYNVGGEKIEVIAVYFHPGYTPSTLKANLCLLRLHRHIAFTKKSRSVKKIDFDREEHQVPTNLPSITIVGWGARGPGNVQYNPWKDTLAHALLSLYSFSDCRGIYSKTYVTRTNFCAGFISYGGGACNHDVGAPGIFGEKLLGVVSFGSPVCGAPDSPTVFTKLGFYTDWIEEIMEMPVSMGMQRTTKYKFPQFTTPFTHVIPDAPTFFVTPVDEVDEHTFDDFKLPETTEPSRPEEKKSPMLREKSLFNDFLKTMFTSNEVVQYQDMFDEELSRLQAKKDAILAGRQAGSNEGAAGPDVDKKMYGSDWSEEVKVKPVTEPLSLYHKHTTKDYTDVSEESSFEFTKKKHTKKHKKHKSYGDYKSIGDVDDAYDEYNGKGKEIVPKKYESYEDYKGLGDDDIVDVNDDDNSEGKDKNDNDDDDVDVLKKGLFEDIEDDELGVKDEKDDAKDSDGDDDNDKINSYDGIDNDAGRSQKKKLKEIIDNNDMVYDTTDTTLHPKEEGTPHDFTRDVESSPKKQVKNFDHREFTKHNFEPILNSNDIKQLEIEEDDDDEYVAENVVDAYDKIVTDDGHDNLKELFVDEEDEKSFKKKHSASRNAGEKDPDYYSLLEPSNKDLEKEIVNLIDDIDLKEIIQDSSRELNREVRKFDSKNIFLTTTPMPSSNTSRIENLEKLDKEYEEKNTKIDEAMLRLFYLSDQEKGEGNLDKSDLAIPTGLTLRHNGTGKPDKSDLFDLLKEILEE